MWEPERNEGENHHGAKLTEREVVCILRILKREYMEVDEIAEVFGVTVAAICAIRDNRTWRFISRYPGQAGFTIVKSPERRKAVIK